MWQPRADSSLTPREIAVVALRAQEAWVRRIAQRLNIRSTNVDRYLDRIAGKTGSRHRDVLVRYARENNLHDAGDGSRQ